ncbi:hypothetical protein LEMLEM_LOCUS15096 [Lemmus lemmus]
MLLWKRRSAFVSTEEENLWIPSKLVWLDGPIPPERTFHDNEIHLLLAAANYFKRKMGSWSKRLLMDFVSHWARNCSCLDCLMVCCMNWTCKTHRKVTAEHSKTWDGPSWFLLHRSCQTFYRTEENCSKSVGPLFHPAWLLATG